MPAEQTAAVIMAAWKTEDYILDAAYSFRSQVPLPGWRYELRIATDGCERTSQVLQEAEIPHWQSEENVGPYIIRNSLIQLRPADVYVIFDSDDVMLPSFLRYNLPMCNRENLIGPSRVDIFPSENRHRRKRKPWDSRYVRFQGGISFIHHSIWEELGGFRGKRVAGDSDLMFRAEAIGAERNNILEPTYIRRVREDSQTSKCTTGIRSQYRERIKKRYKYHRNMGVTYVEPKTVPLSRWEP